MAKAEQDRGMRIQGYLGALTRPGTRGNLGDEKVRNKLREESRNPSKAARLYPLRQSFRQAESETEPSAPRILQLRRSNMVEAIGGAGSRSWQMVGLTNGEVVDGRQCYRQAAVL